jgi:type I restriction enzyme R subunit
VKSGTGTGKSAAQKDAAVQQIISRAVGSTEIVDILAAAGAQDPGHLDPLGRVPRGVQQMPAKNLALEALKRLLGDEICSLSRTNVVEMTAFSELLEQAVARYHTNAVTTVEVLQELIALARDIRAARKRGEEQGLTDEEVAFYDALAENESAVQVMGDDKLRVIAHELLTSLRANVTVDWSQRESARARMRLLVKKILKRYGYPPDMQDAAVQTVLQQAEVLSARWAA